MQVRVSFVSPVQTKRAQGNYRIKGQHITKIQPSNISERTLTTALAALLSFPMAQPAMRSQLLRPTASHIIQLKNTNAEGPSTFDCSQTIWPHSRLYSNRLVCVMLMIITAQDLQTSIPPVGLNAAACSIELFCTFKCWFS